MSNFINKNYLCHSQKEYSYFLYINPVLWCTDALPVLSIVPIKYLCSTLCTYSIFCLVLLKTHSNKIFYYLLKFFGSTFFIDWNIKIVCQANRDKQNFKKWPINCKSYSFLECIHILYKYGFVCVYISDCVYYFVQSSRAGK